MSRRRQETLEEYELRVLRAEAERRDARRNEVITRGELLDTLDNILALQGMRVLSGPDYIVTTVVRSLREAFE